MCRVSVFCCCGCSLRSGAITAAVLNALDLLLILIGAADYFEKANIVESDDISTNRQSFVSDADPSYYRIVAGVCLFIALIAFIILVCLFIGIAENKANCVMPWLIGYMIKIVIVGMVLTYMIYRFKILWIIIVGLSVLLAFDIYMWIVVLNYYRELKGSSGYQPAIVFKA